MILIRLHQCTSNISKSGASAHQRMSILSSINTSAGSVHHQHHQHQCISSISASAASAHQQHQRISSISSISASITGFKKDICPYASSPFISAYPYNTTRHAPDTTRHHQTWSRHHQIPPNMHNVWFVWSKTSYSGDKWICYQYGQTDGQTNQQQANIELLNF